MTGVSSLSLLMPAKKEKEKQIMCVSVAEWLLGLGAEDLEGSSLIPL